MINNTKFATKIKHFMDRQKRETKTAQRHADIYNAFLKACKELNPPNRHFNLNMKQIYSDIAEEFRYSPEHVYRVINKMMKKSHQND